MSRCAATLVVLFAALGLGGCHSVAVTSKPVAARRTVPDSAAAPATEPTRNPADDGVAALEARIRGEIDGGTVPSVALAVASNGVIRYENAFGWADKENGIEAGVHTPYALASLTKPLVATALMVLYERGEVDLDAPALNYAADWLSPDATGAYPRYTVRQLLNHTSGLGTYARILTRSEARGGDELRSRFARYGFTAHPPGTVSEYSNLGYGLLGHIIARQSGRALPEFMRGEIFEPLGMHDAAMPEPFATPPVAARKYDTSLGVLPDTYNDTPGAGNIYASIDDLMRFGLFHLGRSALPGAKAVLAPETIELMRSYVEPGALYPYYGSSHYGLGWYFRNAGSGRRVVWHEGGMPGASAILVLLPDHGIAAAVLINATDKNDLAQSLANDLIEVVNGQHVPVSFNAIDGFALFDAEPGFLGRWKGSVRIDGKDIPCTLTFEAGGHIIAAFPGRADNGLLPARTEFRGLVNDDLLVATFMGTLPAADVAQRPGTLVLLRLLREGNVMSGTMVAYASAERLEHLYPFAVRLDKVD